jgi:pilus assembly protein CpaE
METAKTKIILFSDDQERITFLERFFHKDGSANCTIDLCPTKISTEEIFLRYSPDIILIDMVSLSLENREYLMSKLERISEMIPLIGIFEESQKMMALEYVRRGIRDMLEVPFKDYEILKVIGRFKKETTRSPLKKTGQVNTFFSFKGGIGNTFITLNTAISMARKTKKRVLLWDMALQAGDIPFFLNFQPEYTLSDLVDNINQIDHTYLDGVLAPHPCGVSVLSAPIKIEDIEKLTPDLLEKILNLFTHHFDYIFIDGGYRLTDALIPLIDASSYLFITTTLELISLRSASRCLEILEKLNFSPEKIKIVINRYNAKHEALTIDKAKKILKFDIVDFIPNDYETASKSVNMGQSIVDVAPNSLLDKKIQAFAHKIETNFSEGKQSSSLLETLTQHIRKVLPRVA